MGLLKTEGGHVGGWTTNVNGSHDLGPMQVNDSSWAQKVADLQFSGNKTAAEAALIYDGCYNVEVGAWIYRQFLNEAHGDYGVAVGYYNSHNPEAADKYRILFLHSLMELGFAGRHQGTALPPAAPDAPNAYASAGTGSGNQN